MATVSGLPAHTSAGAKTAVCAAMEDEPPSPSLGSLETRRDENKENIAPIRQVPAAILAEEHAVRTHDAIAMRTRRRMAARPVTPPSTPKKRRDASAQYTTPSKRSKTLDTPPPTPTPSVYAQARALLRKEVLVGRCAERSKLHEFLDTSLQGNSSGCLHISGMPGTGKTALVRDVMRERTDEHMYMNCVGLSHPQEAAHRVAAALNVPDVSALECLSTSRRHSLVVVLDEMDLWLHTHRDMLYRMFCLPKLLYARTQGAVRLALIGIANSLDLTEQFLPVLRSQGVSPSVLHFSPMPADEVQALLAARLHDVPSAFTHAALQLLARKLTASTGDIRRALDTCRQALDLAEADQRGSVTPTHILRVFSQMAGHAQVSRVRALGVHAKLLLLAWIILQQHAEAGLVRRSGTTRGDGGVSLSDLEAEYTRMLEYDAAFVAPLGGSELLDVLERLEVQGLVRIWSEAGSSQASSSSVRVSPSAKRAAARQMLATNRRMAPTLERECLVRALTTGATSPAEAADTTHTPTVVDAMTRLLERADLDIARQTKWRVDEQARVRKEELGGGRGAIADM